MTAPNDIDKRIAMLGDWRGAALAKLRKTIFAADPDITEDVKWRKPSNPLGVAAWECSGLICTGETYKDKVKLTFAHGAALPDPAGLFNASLDGNVRRAIDLHESETIDTVALTALVRAAVAFNRGKAKKPAAKKTAAKKAPARKAKAGDKT